MIGSVEDLNMYAQQLKSLPQDYYPYFDFCHIILCVLAVRKEAGRNFAWSHPVSAWISCVVASFAGSIICGPLLGIFFIMYVFHTNPLVIPYFCPKLSNFFLKCLLTLLNVCHDVVALCFSPHLACFEPIWRQTWGQLDISVLLSLIFGKLDSHCILLGAKKTSGLD